MPPFELWATFRRLSKTTEVEREDNVQRDISHCRSWYPQDTRKPTTATDTRQRRLSQFIKKEN